MTATSSSLRGRIEGFGSEPDPGPGSQPIWRRITEGFSSSGNDRFSSSASDSVWGQDQSFAGIVSSAKAGLNSMLEAVDGTVNRVADAVDDAFDAIVGDADSMDGDDDAGQKDAEGGTEKADEEKDGAKSTKDAKDRDAEDDGMRSGTDWPRIVSSLCEDGGDIEEFILELRSQSKNEFEEKEVGGLLADQLLKEVKTDAVLRVLHIMQAMVSDGNLDQAIDEVRKRCAVKLKKLRASPLFGALAGEVGGAELDAKAEAASADAAKAAADSRTTAAAPASLLDFAGQSSPAAAPAKKAAGNEVDLLGLAPAPAATASAPSAAAGTQGGRKDYVAGQMVMALWAGDGERYPAIVERTTADFVMVHWMRRAVTSAPEEKFVCEVGDDSSHRSVPRDKVSIPAKDANLLDFDAESTTVKAVAPSSATPSSTVPAASSTQPAAGSLPAALFSPTVSSPAPTAASNALMPQQAAPASGGFDPGLPQAAFGACGGAGRGLGMAMPGAMAAAPGAMGSMPGGGYLAGNSSGSRTATLTQGMSGVGMAGRGASNGYGMSRAYGLAPDLTDVTPAVPDPFAGLGALSTGVAAKTGSQAAPSAVPRRSAHPALQAATPETSSGGVILGSDLALGDVFALAGVRPGTAAK